MADEPEQEEQATSGYPSYVVTDEQKHRWDMAGKAAREAAGEIEGDETTIWLATRALYNSDIPTDPEDPSDD